ncbi:MAG: hypothetical protein PHI97_03850 [Desulfobulbus sp.]|nr:hypothetical protein [Desulfobulbus sp.]
MKLRNFFVTSGDIIRDVLLAAVVSEPEKKVFFYITEQYPRTLHCIAFFFSLYVVFLGLLVGKIAINSFSPGSFIVTARSERIEYQPESIDPPRIPFRDATLYWEENNTGTFDPLVPAASLSRSRKYTGQGSLQIQGRSTIVFSRNGKGPLHIKIKSTGKNAVFDENDEPVLTLPGTIDLVLNNPLNMVLQGIPWRYNIDGPLIVGKVPSYDAYQQDGLLLEGEIHMVARQLLSGNHYKVDPYKLQLGDGLQFLPSAPKTSGVVTFDFDRGLQVVAIVEANSATIKKFRDTNLKIRNNLWSKLGKDEELVITWAIMLAVPGILVFAVRLLYFHSQMKLK